MKTTKIVFLLVIVTMLLAAAQAAFAAPAQGRFVQCKSVCFARTRTGAVDWQAVRSNPRYAVMWNPARLQVFSSHGTLFRGGFATMGGRYYWKKSDFVW